MAHKLADHECSNCEALPFIYSQLDVTYLNIPLIRMQGVIVVSTIC